jgi:hypothetical protein
MAATRKARQTSGGHSPFLPRDARGLGPRGGPTCEHPGPPGSPANDRFSDHVRRRRPRTTVAPRWRNAPREPGPPATRSIQSGQEFSTLIRKAALRVIPSERLSTEPCMDGEARRGITVHGRRPVCRTIPRRRSASNAVSQATRFARDDTMRYGGGCHACAGTRGGHLRPSPSALLSGPSCLTPHLHGRRQGCGSPPAPRTSP